MRHSSESRVLGRAYFTEMCSSSEAGPYLRLTDFVYHSTLGLRVIKKKNKKVERVREMRDASRRRYFEFSGFYLYQECPFKTFCDL